MPAVNVLALEDVVFRYDLHRSLGKRGDLDLHLARSGWELVVGAGQHRPGLVVLDHWIPDLLGDEVLEQIRRQRDLRATPAVLLAPEIGAEALERYQALPPVRLFRERPERDVLVAELLDMLRLCHRRQTRVGLRLPVVLETSGRRTTAQTRDLSSLGASIETRLDLATGAMLELEFETHGVCAPAQARSAAVVKHVGDGVVGVEFSDPPEPLVHYLRGRVEDGQRLDAAIAEFERLPALPSVIARILEECVKEDAELDSIGALVRSDPSLTGFVLKLANSASYRFSEPVTTVERAVALLGLKAVRNGLLGFAIFRHLAGDQRDRLAAALWRHSLACALACEVLAPRFAVPAAEAFTMGLLHDCGKFLLLARIGQGDSGALGTEWTLERERMLYGMDHAAIGAALLAHWRVPEDIHRVVAHHHRPPVDASPGLTNAVYLVRAADSLTYSSHLGDENGIDDGRACLQEKVAPQELEALRSRVFRELTRIGALFDQEVEPADLCTEIVERANWKLATELRAADERNEVLRRAYERTRQHLISLAQSEKHHALGRIARGLTHEINNPLGASIANLSILQEYIADLQALYQQPAAQPAAAGIPDLLADGPDLLQETLQQLGRASAIARSLKTFDAGVGGRKEPVALLDCVREALTLTAPELPGGAEVRVYDSQQPPACADRGAMVRVFTEVIQNALAAMPHGGLLLIQPRSDPGQVAVLIRDTGHGISEDHIKHVFEPFFTTRPVGAGRGLGLSVAYGIVSNHNGQILIQSTPGEGTVVEVRLPVAHR